MKQFHKACVMHFQPNCKEHMNAENLNDDYPFHKDSYLIIQFLKNLHFNKNINITEHDCKELIVEGKLMVGVDFITDDLDKYQYLFDAFNVYVCDEDSYYYTQIPTLTKKWRKTMNNFYNFTSYSDRVKKVYRKEMQDDINAVVEDYDKLIESL